MKNTYRKLKKTFSKNSNSILLTEKLVNALHLSLLNIVSKKIAKKAAQSSREIFKYYINNNVEEVILFMENKENSWQLTYKVLPSYLDNYQNLAKLDLVGSNTILFSLKDFYYYIIKKHCH
jgi:hypothetical protein